MKLDTSDLAGLVASVADGWPQDWTALEAKAADERTRKALRNLRIVAGIAEFHRGTETACPQGEGLSRPEIAPEESTTSGREDEAREVAAEVGRWGRFELRKKLGEGAYGDVYSAYDTQLDRDVALKLLKPSRSSAELTRRLLSEARMLAQVRHPHVASLYGAGEHEGQAGLWMELIRGITLEELLHSRGPMSASEAALVGQDLCRALAAVHAAGLVHRDVKTSNVMREVGGRIVLTDFGAGRYQGLEGDCGVAGTPYYVAPEIVAGFEATVLSDIYSLGVVLFRLVTRAYPRVGGRLDDRPEGFDSASPRSLHDLRPDLPDAFVAAVERALAPDPTERHPSAGMLRAALGLVLGVPASWRKARSVCGRPPTLRRTLPPDDPSRPPLQGRPRP
jgi:eukaryotic-like serine/threonine-protein kinase